MSTTTMRPATGAATFTPAGDLAVAWRRIGWELRSYFRQPMVVLFTFAFPVLLMLLFAAAFGGFGEIPPTSVTMTDIYVPSLLAAGVVLSGIQNLSVDIASERGDGTLRRLAATPLLPWQYFVGKLGQAFVTGFAQAVLLLAVGTLVLGVALPTDPMRWLTVAWVFVLGLTGSALLGIALSSLAKDSKAATAIIIPLLLALQFVSGVFLPLFMLPDWLQTVSGALPIRWIAQGFRAALLPEEAAQLEQTGSFELGMVAIMLAAWVVVGFVLARLTFRWLRRS